MRAYRAFYLMTMALLLWAATISAGARAQVLVVSAAGASGLSASATSSSFSVALRDVRVSGTTVGVAIGHANGAVQLDTSLSANQTFGPLGNVIFELTGSLRTDAEARARLAVRGTIGPVAARVGITAFSADDALFSFAAVAADDRPTLGGAGVGADIGVTARFGRNVILDVDPDFYLTSSGLTARLDARLRRLRTFGDNELRLYLSGAAMPARTAATASTTQWHAAAGAGVLWPRGRAPDIEVAALVGMRGAVLAPGLRVSLAESLPSGVRLSLDGSLELYRVDVAPLRLRANVALPLAGGTLGFTAVGAALDPARQAAFALEASFTTSVTLP